MSNPPQDNSNGRAAADASGEHQAGTPTDHQVRVSQEQTAGADALKIVADSRKTGSSTPLHDVDIVGSEQPAQPARPEHKPLTRPELTAMAEAIDQAANGGFLGIGTDKEAINEQLRRLRTPEERQLLDEIYRKKVGHGIEDELRDELSGSDLDKSLALWRSDNVDTARVEVALEEHKEWGFSARSNEICEKDIRDTVSTMNSTQIAAMDADYRARHDGVGIRDALMKDPDLSADTKAVLDIYLKGTDKRTDEDTQKLADIALKGKNLDMFNEVFRDASQTARDSFLEHGGRDKIMKAFGTPVGRGSQTHRIENENTRHAMDYVRLGKLDVATRVSDNTGVFNDNEAAIEQTLKTMTDAERQSYKDGRRLAESGSSRDSLSEADRTSLDYYTRIHDSLTRAGNEREVAKWEDLIDNKEGGLVTRLAAHGGIIDDSMDQVLGTIEHMSDEDVARLKSDPEYLKRVRDVLAIDLNEDEQKRANDLIDRKLEGGQRSITESIKDKTGFWNTDEEGIYDAIKHMTPEEQARYRENEDFRKEVDGLVRSSLDYGHEQKAAFELLDSIKRGDNPENNIIAKLHEHADHFNTDEGQVVADLEKAFKDDPGLRDRIKNDPEYARRFNEAIHAALDPYEYQRYAKPLIDDGRLPFKVKAELYNGVFDDDEKGLFQAISAGSPEDWKEITDNPASVLPFLSESERQIAVNIASQNGEMRPEDKLRAAVIGMGTDVTAIKQVLEGMSPADLQKVKDDYLSKYKSDLLGDLMSDEGGAIRELFVDKVGEQPQSDREAFNIASQRVYKSVDGVGRSLVDTFDGTADMSMDALNQFAGGMSEYSRRFEEMPADKRQELQENLMKAVELYRESESSAADTLVDGAIIAAGIGGAAFTGGVSLSLLACTTVGGALFKVGAKSVIIGNDYEFASTQMLADAATGGIDAATIFLGPAQFAQLANLGKASAGTAARGILSAADDLALASGRQILKEGASETLERKLFEQVAFAISNGSESVDEKVITRLAREFASSADDIPQVKQLIGKSLQEAVNAEATSAIKTTARELALNSAAGNVGGGLSGMVYGATEWDASRSFGDNLAILGQQGFTGAAMGTGMAFGFTAGFKVVGRGLGALRHVDAPHGSVVDNAAADVVEDALEEVGHAPTVVAASGALAATEQAGAHGLKDVVEEVLPGNLHADAHLDVGASLDANPGKTVVGESGPVDFSPERTEVGKAPDSLVAQRVPVEGAEQNFSFGDRVQVSGSTEEAYLRGVDFETGQPIVEFPDREHYAVRYRRVENMNDFRPIKIDGEDFYRDQHGIVYSITDYGEGPMVAPVHKYEVVDGKTLAHAPAQTGDANLAAGRVADAVVEPPPLPRPLPVDRVPLEPPAVPQGRTRFGEGYHSTGIYDDAYLTVNGYRMDNVPSYDGNPLSLGRHTLGGDFGTNVSRDHAQIKWDPDQQMYFMEERSLNGTYLKRSGESEFQFLPGGKDDPYRVYIGPNDTVRLGAPDGPEIRLNVPDSVAGHLKPQVGPGGDVDVRVFFDGKPLQINDDGEMLIGRVHQQVGPEGLSDILDRRVASNHAKLRWDENAGKWEFTDLTGAPRRNAGDYTGTVVARRGGNGTFIRRENGQVEFLQGASTYLGPNDSVHLGAPDGPELKFITNQGHRLPDGRVEVPRKNFDMAVKRPDGTTEITTFLNFRRLEDPQGRVIQTLDPKGARRGFEYEGDGSLKRIKFDDDSVVERTAGDVWVRTTPDGRRSEFWRGDIEIEPDGAVRYRDTGEPPAYTIDRVDGTREVVHSNGRVEYKNVDFQNELSYMNGIMNSFDDNSQRLRFKQMMNDFEKRAREAGLSAEEKALTFHHVRRLYQAEYGAFLTAPERSGLAEQIFFLAAHPEKVCQGANSTCNVSTLERRLFAKNPSEAVRLISDVVITGKYVTANGVKVDLGRIPGVLAPDSEARMLARGFSADGSDLKIDGRRTYASQIFETTAVNLNWAQSAEYKLKPGDMVVYEKVPGPVTGSGTEELVRYSIDSLGNLNREVVKNSPHIYVSDLEPLYRQISGTTDSNFVLWHGANGINSADDLRRSIERIEKEGGPGVIMVHTRNEPFWTDSGGGVAGGSGGWHVVNVEGVRKDPRTGRYVVDVTNQWNDASHHVGDQAIPLEQLFESMKKPASAGNTPDLPGGALDRTTPDAAPHTPLDATPVKAAANLDGAVKAEPDYLRRSPYKEGEQEWLAAYKQIKSFDQRRAMQAQIDYENISDRMMSDLIPMFRAGVGSSENFGRFPAEFRNEMAKRLERQMDPALLRSYTMYIAGLVKGAPTTNRQYGIQILKHLAEHGREYGDSLDGVLLPHSINSILEGNNVVSKTMLSELTLDEQATLVEALFRSGVVSRANVPDGFQKVLRSMDAGAIDHLSADVVDEFDRVLDARLAEASKGGADTGRRALATLDRLKEPEVERSHLDRIFGSLTPYDRNIAMQILADNKEFLTMPGLNRQFDELAETLRSNGVLTATHKANLRGNSIETVQAVVFDESGSGSALAYLFRKHTGIDVDIKVVKSPADLPEGKFVVFDPMPPEGSPLHLPLEDRLTSAGADSAFQPEQLTDFHRNFNMFDLSTVDVDPERLRQKVAGMVADAKARGVYADMPVTASNTPAAISEKEYGQLNDLLRDSHERSVELKTKLYYARTAGAVPPEDLEILSYRNLSERSWEVDFKLTDDGTRHEDLIFITDADPGGSSHLVSHIYRQANGINPDQFVSLAEAKRMASRGELDGKKVVILDDIVGSGASAAGYANKLNEVIDISGGRARGYIAHLAGTEEGLARAQRAINPPSESGQFDFLNPDGRIELITASDPLTVVEDGIPHRKVSSPGKGKTGQDNEPIVTRVVLPYMVPNTNEARINEMFVTELGWPDSLSRGDGHKIKLSARDKASLKVPAPDYAFIENSGVVQDGLGIVVRGSALSPEDLDRLVRENQTAVIVDLRATTGAERKGANLDPVKESEWINNYNDSPAGQSHPVEYHQIGFSTAKDGLPSEADVDHMIEVIQDAALDGKKVYVHCEHGRDRTGLMMALYEVAAGMDPQEAYRRMVAFGFRQDYLHMKDFFFAQAERIRSRRG